MLAQVVMFAHVRGNTGLLSTEKYAAKGKPGDVFENVGVLNRFGR